MIQLIHGDCLIESDKIESGSVDLILTDLPYGNMNTDGGRKLGINGWDLAIEPKKVFGIANRILRKNGKMVLFGQESYISKLITGAIPDLPFGLKIIWEKDSYGSHLKCNKAPLGYFEEILVFSKTHDHLGLHPLREYFKEVLNFIGLNKKEIIEKIGQKVDHTFRVNSTQYGLCTKKTYIELTDVFKIDKMDGFKTYKELKEIDNKFSSTFNLWQGNKYKSNILKYKKDYDGHHPTQKPILLLEDLIKTFSNEGDLVVDLTAGSGSTPVACDNTGRGCIAIENNDKYFDIMTNRVAENKKRIEDTTLEKGLFNE